VILHNFFRSSTSTRLRVALNLKGLGYDYVAYPLREKAHKTPAFLAKNPAGLVPVLEIDDGTMLTQSLAIIEYLDEVHPEPALLPSDPLLKAKARAYAYMIACEIHPLNNLRVLQTLGTEFGADDAAQKAWFTRWVSETFDALEVMLSKSPETGRHCIGDTPGLADICLYAQVWNNQRFGISLEPWPTIARIYEACHAVEAFAKAAPPQQPDAA
jgi:maleylpyruvate isomerase